MASTIHGIRVLGSSFAAETERSAVVEGLRICRINLANVASKATLLEVIGKQLGLPEYFGRNWDSLEECLRDLEEGLGWLVVFEGADNLQALPRQDLATLRQILVDTAEFWRAEGRIFGVVFVGSPSLSTALGSVGEPRPAEGNL